MSNRNLFLTRRRGWKVQVKLLADMASEGLLSASNMVPCYCFLTYWKAEGKGAPRAPSVSFMGILHYSKACLHKLFTS